MIDIIGLPEEALKQHLTDWGEASYRTHQILGWIYQRGCRDFEDMSNVSKALKVKLKESFNLRLPVIKSRTRSEDGSIKYLFELASGGQVESIWMPDGDRRTLCISSQVGCRLACSFCLTGTLGLKDQLTAGEILGQFMAVNDDLPQEKQVTNIVMMGMGEPLDNYEPVVDAIKLLISTEALRFPIRKVTVSTSGLVEKIRDFGNEGLNVNLAVSLNATDNETRDKIMPINKKYPIESLIDCLKDFPLKAGRRITVEYVMLGGINDRMEDARRLSKLLSGFPCKINLIPFNWYESSIYKAPDESQVEAFRNYLVSKHYSTFVRKNRGTDILGACGQLAAESFPQASLEDSS